MRKHNTFWLPRGAGRVRKECQIFLWIWLGSAISACTSQVLDAAEMLIPIRRVFFVSDQDYSLLRDADLSRGLLSDVKARHLRRDCPGTRVFQLKGKLLWLVSRIGSRYDTACPMTAPYQARKIDTVGCE